MTYTAEMFGSLSDDFRFYGNVWPVLVLAPSISLYGGGRLASGIRRFLQKRLAGLCLEFHRPSIVSRLDSNRIFSSLDLSFFL